MAPLKILFLGANPADTLRLRLGEEMAEIERRILRSRERERIQLVSAWAPTVAELGETLLHHRPAIVHFSGHGNAQGELLLLDGTAGRSAPVPAERLARLFAHFAEDGLRCVVLNACYSATQAPAIAASIDYVVGMADRIGDPAAQAFAAGFYTALGAGEPLSRAFDFGCLQIDLLGLAGAERLREHVRPGLDPAALCLFRDAPQDTLALGAGAPASLADPLAEWIAFGLERHRKLRVLGFREQHQISLDLDRVFVPLVLSAAPRRRRGETGPALDTKPNVKTDTKDEVLHGGERAVTLDEALGLVEETEGAVGLVLLGHAGAGKTTLLKHLFCRAAQGAFSGSLAHLRSQRPVLLRLANVRDDERCEGGLAAAVAREARASGHADAAAWIEAHKKQRFLFLLDGLDEVRDEPTRLGLCDWLNREVDHWPGSRFVVTSRFAAWQRTPRLDNQFLTLQLRGLDAPRVEDYVQRWFRAVELAFRGTDPVSLAEERATERAQALLDAITDPRRRANMRLREMTDNPLLLSTLCLLHHSDRHLPDKRGELYDRSLGLLLDTWARERTGDVALPSDAARLVLQPLAHAMHERNVREIDAADAEALVRQPLTQVTALRHLAPAAFLERVRDECGVLASRDLGRYEFFHLSFQEYLSAAHIARERREEALAAQAGDPRWEEVLLLAMTFPGVFRAFTECMLAREDLAQHATLLRLCLAETVAVDEAPFVAAFERGLARLDHPEGAWSRLWRKVLARPEPQPAAAELRTLLELLRGYEPPAVLERVRRLADHPDAALRAAVRASLGMPAPNEVSASRWVQLGQALVEPTLGMPFVWVPPGRFLMGSSGTAGEPGYDPEGYADERPAHEVTLTSGYWIGWHPVTNREYAEFIEQTGAPAPPLFGDRRFNDPAQPVVGIAWDDAERFVAWLTERSVGALRFALPSEAEWEYAARGSEGRRYPWGHEPPSAERAHFDQPVDTGRPSPIGQHPTGRSPFGAEDMAGNVWEWCGDAWRDDYGSDAAVRDPCHQGDTAGAPRVVRGGSWLNDPGDMRAAYRRRRRPGRRGDVLGFRVVCRVSRQQGD